MVKQHDCTEASYEDYQTCFICASERRVEVEASIKRNRSEGRSAEPLFTLRLSEELLKAFQDEQRDLAAVARAGGRLITAAVAHKVYRDDERHEYDPSIRDQLSGAFGQSAVNRLWDFQLDPAGHNGAKGWRWSAEREAGVGRFGSFGPQDPTVTAVLLKDAEQMVGWPIYRAAVLAGAR